MDAENVISVFRREIADNCALLDYHAACSGNSSQTFRDNLSVPSSRVKKLRTVDFLPMQLEQMGSPETSVWNYHYTLYDIPEKRSSQACGRFL